jgi:hypothetical protein
MENTGNIPLMVRRNIQMYAVLSTAALLTVVAVSASGGATSTFMWVRAGLLPLLSSVLLRLSPARLRVVTVVLPVAIIGIDLVPGVCPLWFAVLQAVCMLPIVRIAVAVRR